jgi:3-methylcrotonyl-CoA carboxylase alpha subunit
LDGDRIIQVAKEQGCQGIHPGYGFLSENPAFARKCTEAGITFIGPPWRAIEAMGSKSEAKDIMTTAGVPCIPGYHGSNQDPEYLKNEAEKIGYPVLLKAVRGGGGKGMRIVKSADEFLSQLESAKSEARNSFGDEVMLVEKYITTPRHIEVQVFADKHGNCVALGERDCSIQRRHQKILEESPAPHLNEATRQDLWEKARAAALAVGYEGAGTVEFIFDANTGKFFFMEMNTRLQVEHPVTEMVCGEDLVRWQLIVAEGGKLPLTQKEIETRIAERGHAIEARIYAENPDMGFIPDSGKLLHLKTPRVTETVRIDAGFVQGDEVSSFYDPMIAKLIVRGTDRKATIHKLRAALEEYEIAGPSTNIEFLKRMCISSDFVEGAVETGYVQTHDEELFKQEPAPPELFAQAALGLLLKEAGNQKLLSAFRSQGEVIGFNPTYQQRSMTFTQQSTGNQSKPSLATVRAIQTSSDKYKITIEDLGIVYDNVMVSFDANANILTSYYPHTRLATTIVYDPSQQLIPTLTLFQRGKQYKVSLEVPKWTAKALKTKAIASSVLAPMPCKVLRIEVEAGQNVIKDQPLVVIESMKMETVICSPHDGIVERIVHGKGEVVKAGMPLVEFAEEKE